MGSQHWEPGGPVFGSGHGICWLGWAWLVVSEDEAACLVERFGGDAVGASVGAYGHAVSVRDLGVAGGAEDAHDWAFWRRAAASCLVPSGGQARGGSGLVGADGVGDGVGGA